jgi:hypothetical protein
VRRNPHRSFGTDPPNAFQSLDFKGRDSEIPFIFHAGTFSALG